MVSAGRNDRRAASRLQRVFRRALEGEAGLGVVRAMRDSCPDARRLHYGLMMAAFQIGLVVVVVRHVLFVRIRRIVVIGCRVVVAVCMAVSVVARLRREDCGVFMSGPACGVVGR